MVIQKGTSENLALLRSLQDHSSDNGGVCAVREKNAIY